MTESAVVAPTVRLTAEIVSIPFPIETVEERSCVALPDTPITTEEAVTVPILRATAETVSITEVTLRVVAET
jgi:hypothetical protein